MKKKSILVSATLVLLASFAVPANGLNVTLTDEALMSFDWYGGLWTPVVTGQRDVTGPGVEFDIYYPGNEEPDSAAYYISSRDGGAGALVGIDLSAYDNFDLKYTLVSVDGSTAPDAGGRLSVGAYVGQPGTYRPEIVSFWPGEERTRISSTPLGALNAPTDIDWIGIHAHMTSAEGWDASGVTVTLLVEAAPGAVPIPEPTTLLLLSLGTLCFMRKRR